MIGNAPDIKDIELELDNLVLPHNLLSDESLSPDDVQEEEEEQFAYRVDTSCYSCGTGVRLTVWATHRAIQTLQLLLTQELNIVCPGCSRHQFHDGRSR
uniref:Protein E7 n=1 Tax=Human papillomavirus TaxID=10566 RepID=A0A385PNG2_9PAPI|nr:MAG: E7 protein [Human papillomavirus]